MKTCPECGIALKDEYQFCPEDGAALAELPTPIRVAKIASAKPPSPSAVVLYCPACAAEYPLTFSECPVHHTELARHGIPLLVKAPAPQAKIEQAADKDITSTRHLHLVSAEAQPRPATDVQPRRTSLEAYEQTVENLAQPVVSEAIGEPDELPQPPDAAPDEGRIYRKLAIGVTVTLALLALIGIYSVISNASRKPAQSLTKKAIAKESSGQPALTIQTPQTAVDYQEPATAQASPSADRDQIDSPRIENAGEAQTQTRRSLEPSSSQTAKAADARTTAAREPVAAPSPRPVQPVSTSPARSPAATELVLPRGTYGLVEARLAGVRASRTAAGYRYDLTFHMADQAGHATQWERLAIVTRAASGASRQQQIPFYHRLGADGSLQFTVSVEMPGRAPADWQGRIICTSIGSDSSGKSYRASFGASVSPN